MEPNALPFDGLRVPGAMARNVGDVALFMAAVAGPSQSAPLHAASDPEPFFNLEPMDIRGVRVAWDPAPCGSATDPAVSRLLQKAIALLAEQGCVISNACPKLDNAVAATRVFRNLSAAVECGQHVREAGHRLSPTVVQAVKRGSSHAAEDIIDAQQAQAECWHRLCDFFDSHDAIIWPTSCVLPLEARLSATDYVLTDWRPIELTAALQLPAVTLPVGLSEDGLPVGMQIIAPRGRDVKLLRFAAAIEEIVGFGQMPVDLLPSFSAPRDASGALVAEAAATAVVSYIGRPGDGRLGSGAAGDSSAGHASGGSASAALVATATSGQMDRLCIADPKQSVQL